MDHHRGSPDHVATGEKKRHSIAKFLLKLGISCVLLGLILWRVPLTDIGAHLRSFGAGILLAAIGLSLVQWGIAAVRLWCLLPEFRYRDLLHATFVAKFYGTILPGQVAGDVVKAYRLGRQSDRAGHAEAATAVDRGVGLFALFIISAIAALHSAHLPLPLRLFFVCGVIAMAACGVAASSRLFRLGVVDGFLSRRHGRIGTFLHDFSIALHNCMRRPLALIAAMVPAILFHAACVWMQVLLGDSLGIRLSWSDWTCVYAGISLLMVLPVSVAGLGLREGGYVGLLALFGYEAGVALSLSFAVFGVSLAGAVLGGALELVTALRRAEAAPKRGKSSN
ncbi:MAG TPA: lysylphosphatidylglycerol synthase transmembrane domain-containing protein [Bryobacteraceae bacterium]|nr:lysylphosphatidylglycerol synthase transmembrane domain-containing protein [Bryobacteraceae bacterium]